MDAFAEYYEKMQKWTETPIYFACAKGKYHLTDEARQKYAEDVAKSRRLSRAIFSAVNRLGLGAK